MGSIRPGFQRGIVLFSLLILAAVSQADRSNLKRGVLFPSQLYPNNLARDAPEWMQDDSPISWYYNNKTFPFHTNDIIRELEFVPMFWTPDRRVAVGGGHNDTSFLTQMEKFIMTTEVGHVLTFPAPEMDFRDGGSEIEPYLAAKAWVNNIVPLQKQYGIKAGLPATASASKGFPWLDKFLTHCSEMLSANGTKQDCLYSFVAFHHVGDIPSMVASINEYTARFPNTPLWMSFDYPNQSLESTQAAIIVTTEYLDKLSTSIIERYAFTGAFRTSVASKPIMGSDALTDFGLWYVGMSPPTDTKKSASPSTKTLGMVSALAVTVCIVVACYYCL